MRQILPLARVQYQLPLTLDMYYAASAVERRLVCTCPTFGTMVMVDTAPSPSTTVAVCPLSEKRYTTGGSSLYFLLLPFPSFFGFLDARAHTRGGRRDGPRCKGIAPRIS